MYSLEQKTSSNHVTDKGCKWDSLNGSDSADKRSIWCSVLQKRLFFSRANYWISWLWNWHCCRLFILAIDVSIFLDCSLDLFVLYSYREIKLYIAYFYLFILFLKPLIVKYPARRKQLRNARWRDEVKNLRWSTEEKSSVSALENSSLQLCEARLAPN